MTEDLHFEPAVNRPDLLSPGINELLKNWRGSTPVEEILVTPIDPEYADSAKFCEHYGIDRRTARIALLPSQRAAKIERLRLVWSRLIAVRI